MHSNRWDLLLDKLDFSILFKASQRVQAVMANDNLPCPHLCSPSNRLHSLAMLQSSVWKLAWISPQYSMNIPFWWCFCYGWWVALLQRWWESEWQEKCNITNHYPLSPWGKLLQFDNMKAKKNPNWQCWTGCFAATFGRRHLCWGRGWPQCEGMYTNQASKACYVFDWQELKALLLQLI